MQCLHQIVTLRDFPLKTFESDELILTDFLVYDFKCEVKEKAVISSVIE